VHVCVCLQNRGNILKVDRHKYVKIGYHGFQPLTPDERKYMYNSALQVKLAWGGVHACIGSTGLHMALT